MHVTKRSSSGLLRSLAALLVVSLAPVTASAHAIDHLQDKTDVGRNKVPHKGTSHILVIPSRTGFATFPQNRWQELQEYFDPEGGPGTFRGYWQTESGGLYDPIPTLVDPVLYPDECPIPGKPLNNCQFYLDDAQLLFSGAIKDALVDLLERVRDEQGVDFSHFDVNGLEEGQPDGWFDGIILSTDLFDGLGLPLGALGQDFAIATTPRAIVDAGPGSDGGLDDGGVDDGGSADAGLVDAGPPEDLGPLLSVGVIAFIPPDTHEFGHNLGFMDLYQGPVITDVMGRPGSGLSAHSRLQIGWGEVQDVTGAMEITLPPVLEGGSILRFGAPPRYVLLENRSGIKHNQYEDDFPGIYLYSIDENELPTGELGFLDVNNGDLFLPNKPEPKQGNLDCVDECYLNVNIPVGCRFAPADDFDACVLGGDGVKRNVTHAADGHLGFYVEQVSRDFDGNITLKIVEGELIATDAGPDGEPADAGAGDAGDTPPEEGCGCRSTGEQAAGSSAGLALVCLLLLSRRRRRSCGGRERA